MASKNDEDRQHERLLERALRAPPGLAQKALKAIVRLPMKAWRTTVHGVEGIPDDGGVLIASNHGSYLDHFFLAFRIRRPVNFMAAAELFSNPIAGRILSALGAFPVRRGSHDERSIETATELVRQGRLVVIYPQGGIRPALDSVPPRHGIGLVASASEAPVIPAGIIDATTLHRTGFLRFPRVTVRFGNGLMVEEAEQTKDGQEVEAERITTVVWDEVVELNRRGH